MLVTCPNNSPHTKPQSETTDLWTQQSRGRVSKTPRKRVETVCHNFNCIIVIFLSVTNSSLKIPIMLKKKLILGILLCRCASSLPTIRILNTAGPKCEACHFHTAFTALCHRAKLLLFPRLSSPTHSKTS